MRVYIHRCNMGIYSMGGVWVELGNNMGGVWVEWGHNMDGVWVEWENNMGGVDGWSMGGVGVQ